MFIGDVGASIIGHNIGIAASARGRVVNGPSFGAEKGAVIMLVHHLLILFIKRLH